MSECHNCEEGAAGITSKEDLLTTLQVRDGDKEKDYWPRMLAVLWVSNPDIYNCVFIIK